jgi:DNA-binding transcriptional regulator YdaS (Cro superfamily)
MAMKGLRKAINLAGGPVAFAKLLKINRRAVWQWQEVPPAARVIEIERLTGVPREELRPDLYLAPRPRRKMSNV